MNPISLGANENWKQPDEIGPPLTSKWVRRRSLIAHSAGFWLSGVSCRPGDHGPDTGIRPSSSCGRCRARLRHFFWGLSTFCESADRATVNWRGSVLQAASAGSRFRWVLGESSATCSIPVHSSTRSTLRYWQRGASGLSLEVSSPEGPAVPPDSQPWRGASAGSSSSNDRTGAPRPAYFRTAWKAASSATGSESFPAAGVERAVPMRPLAVPDSSFRSKRPLALVGNSLTTK